MAKTTITVSDLSGEQVTDENAVTVRAIFPDSDKVHVADLTRDELTKLFTNKSGYVMREQQKRGRKAGSTNEDSEETEE